MSHNAVTLWFTMCCAVTDDSFHPSRQSVAWNAVAGATDEAPPSVTIHCAEHRCVTLRYNR